ncbi:MFS transporter [Microtetraspora fusca]|uniref:MFS transporter n=1 Tax=Microtetraspora fusca TaxID=1997 RepID=A0ABW6UX74_MICFU
MPAAASPEPSGGVKGRSAASGTPILVAVIVAVVSYGLMQTMLVPTVGVLQHSLNAGPAAVSWAVLSATLLSSAILTPLISRLGDGHGKRRVMLTVLVVYLVATLGGALSWDIGALIAFRAAQGVSLSLLPLAFGIVRESMPAVRVPGALGLTSAVVGGSAGIALLGGGLITDLAGWRWLFVAGAAMIVAALVLVWRNVPESPERTSIRLDWPGMLSLSAGLLMALLGLTQGASWGWGSPTVIVLLVGGPAVLALFLWIESRVPHPLFPPFLLVRRPIAAVHAIAFLIGANQFVFYVLVPRFAQTPPGSGGLADYGFGMSVTGAALVMLPGTVVMLPANALAARVEARWGRVAAPALGMLTAAAGAVALALAHARVWQFVVFVVVLSVGWGLVMSSLPRLVGGTAPPEHTAGANGVNTVARTVGGAVGSQVAAAVLATMTVPGTEAPAPPGYTASFLIAAGAAMFGAALVPLLRRRVRAPGEAAPAGSPTAPAAPATGTLGGP